MKNTKEQESLLLNGAFNDFVTFSQKSLVKKNGEMTSPLSDAEFAYSVYLMAVSKVIKKLNLKNLEKATQTKILEDVLSDFDFYLTASEKQLVNFDKKRMTFSKEKLNKFNEIVLELSEMSSEKDNYYDDFAKAQIEDLMPYCIYYDLLRKGYDLNYPDMLYTAKFDISEKPSLPKSWDLPKLEKKEDEMLNFSFYETEKPIKNQNFLKPLKNKLTPITNNK